MNIKTILTFLFSLTFLTSLPSHAAGIDEAINNGFAKVTGPFVSFIFSNFPGTNFPWIVLWLVVGASVFTLYFAFVQFRLSKHALALVSGKYDNPEDAGEVSHFQALATALSGTVGLGNIAGVAVAVSIGGAGATFWMILAGLLGMASKFTECTLAVKYRDEHEDGSVSGGPMYYIKKGFALKGMTGFGKVLSVVFAIFCVLSSLGGGNMFQANQAHLQLSGIFGDYPGWITGIVMAVLVFLVIVGGIKSIAKVTDKVVPFMGIIYCGTALIIILMNYDKIGYAIGQIFSGAFTHSGIAGGIVGALIQGFRRAAFSNEAGVGSAAIAHAAVKTNEPITEGFVSMLEPFIDTVVICTMTALVIVITGVLQQDPETGLYVWDATAGHIATLDNASGVDLTSQAFASAFSWFPYILTLAVLLFAFSTMISWSYYGLKAWGYLFGQGKGSQLTYKIGFCVFVIIGAAANLGPVLDFSDAALFSMAVINIFSLYFLMNLVKIDLKDYVSRLKSGAIKAYK